MYLLSQALHLLTNKLLNANIIAFIAGQQRCKTLGKIMPRVNIELLTKLTICKVICKNH